MSWIRRVAAGIVIAALLSGLATWLIPDRPGHGIVFAQVLEHLQSPQSATFVVTWEREDQKAQSTYMILNDTARVEGHEGVVTIADAHQTLILYPDRRMAIRLLKQDSRQLETGTHMWSRDMIDRLRALREGAEEYIGEQEIDGRLAAGYFTVQNGAEWTVWADVESALPIRAELALPLMDATAVFHDFEFGVDLDPELFSLAPPAGYTVHESKEGEFVAIESRDEDNGTTTVTGAVIVGTPSGVQDMSEPTEQDVIEWLRLLAEANEGEFPDEKRTREISESMSPSSPEDEDLDKKMFWMFQQLRASKYLARLSKTAPSGRAFHQYVGWGVKLGDASQPIYAWELPDGQDARYHVIFGDLSARDVDQAEWDDKLAPEVVKRSAPNAQEQ